MTGHDELPRAGTDAADDLDWQLIARVGARDEGAFAILYERYRGYLERFVYRVLRRADLVEDVISEVMLAVWQQAGRTRRLARASTWILGIAHHQALAALRRQRRSDGGGDDDILAERADEGDALATVEADDLLRVALRRLPAEQRAVLELVYFAGLHYREIALVLDCPENTVKTRVFAARQKLRELWPGLTGAASRGTPIAGGSRR